MPCYSLVLEYRSTVIFYTADAQYKPDLLADVYQNDVIFYDCETSKIKTGVHAHYSKLVQASPDIKKTGGYIITIMASY